MDKIDLTFLGRGSNGEAYSFISPSGDKRVIKFTNSDGEFDCTNKLKKLQQNDSNVLKITSKIYETLYMDDLDLDTRFLKKPYKYVIITEYLKTNKSYISKEVYGKLFQFAFARDTSISYFINKRKSGEFRYEMSEDMLTLLEILAIEQKIGAGDLHSGNIGYDKNGNLKGFDFDYVQKHTIKA